MKLTATDLTLGYGDKAVVEGVSLTIERGEMVAIVGPNGSGKSTLLRGLSRLLKPSRGRVLLGETDIRSLSARAVARVLAKRDTRCAAVAQCVVDQIRDHPPDRCPLAEGRHVIRPVILGLGP